VITTTGYIGMLVAIKKNRMRITYITIIALLIFMSCKSHKDKAFDYIDFSYYNGWTDYYSIKILPTGESYVFNDRFKKGQTFLKYQFDKNSLDSIEKLTKLIHLLKVDTAYERNCQDCGMYNMIIKYKDKKFRLYVYGISESNDSIKIVTDLLHYALGFTSKYRDSVSTDFKFESRTRQFYPPPPPPILTSRKFLPPTKLDSINMDKFNE
jgi:hypothetical protein